jgi:thymidylate synthase (FAD)
MINEIKPKVKILSITPDYIKAIWVAARNCYYKGKLTELEGEYTTDKGYLLLRKLIRLNHNSCLEHINFQISLEGVSRSFMAQITRHRHVTFHISSQHFQDHSDYLYVMPKFINSENKKLFINTINIINDTYKKIIENGDKHYIAREVLPNAVSVKIIMTVNLRELRHIIKIREGPENTPEMQEVMGLIRQVIEQKEGVLLWGLV